MGEQVQIIVDGAAYAVSPDQSLLQACLSLGFDLPYFCWHPVMGSVGACRQCAVKQLKDEHDSEGRLVMSCMTPVGEGVRISLVHPDAVAFRASVIEGMMLHHPHDCPVCDEGGHCQLQDMTVMTGHNYRRYRFQKRTFRNQYLGPLVNHEMNRCIQCYRCVRFYREYCGGEDLEAQAISDRVYFGRHADGVFQSEFAGNLAEVCPTGVFTDATLKRHYTRKWDLRFSPSVCAFCGVGCNVSPGERYGSVRVVLNRYNGEVNGYFLCDRGRFGYEYLGSPQRVLRPRVRGVETTPAIALDHLQKLVLAAGQDPPGRMVGIGSPRASLEANVVLRRLVGADRFFAGVRDGEMELLERIAAILRSGRFHAPSLRDIERCEAALVIGEDLTQSAARIALSLRQAMRQKPLREICDQLKIPHWLDHAAREAIQDEHGPLFVLTPAETKLDAIASACHRGAPDDLARLGFEVAHQIDAAQPGAEEWAETAAPIAAALLAAERPLVVSGTSCGSAGVIEAAVAVAAGLIARGKAPELSFVVPEANSLGLALLRPRRLSEGLDMARFDDIEVVIVMETDLERRAPVAEVEAFLGRYRALVHADIHPPRRHLVALDQLSHSTVEAAELVMPAASWTEGDGTYISNEGRAQRFFQVTSPVPEIRESWRWLEQAQGREATLDSVLAVLVEEFPELAAVRQAAPGAEFRLAEQKMPRETHRFSGRTAKDANLDVSEPKPPEDPDSALSFTMEGYAAQPPAALTAYFWNAGWNSPQAQLGYQNEVNQALRGGDAGVRLFEPDASAGQVASGAAPNAFVAQAGRWWGIRLQHLFGSEELSRQGRAIALLVPGAYAGVSRAAAAAAGWKEGQAMEVEIDGRAWRVPLRLIPGLAAGLVALPAGFAAFDGAALPGWCRLAALEAGK